MAQTQTVEPNRGTGRTTRQLLGLINRAFRDATATMPGEAVFVLGRSCEFVHTVYLISDCRELQELGVEVYEYRRCKPVVRMRLTQWPDRCVNLRLVTAAAWPEAQRTFAREVPYAIDHAAYR